jgi:hypothetical protein
VYTLPHTGVPVRPALLGTRLKQVEVPVEATALWRSQLRLSPRRSLAWCNAFSASYTPIYYSLSANMLLSGSGVSPVYA